VHVPIIDMHRGLRDDPGAAAAVAAEIGQACETSGFFVIVGHGISDDLIADMDGVTRQFFALPEEVKRVVRRVGAVASRGYRGSSVVALARSLDVETPPDLVEVFSASNVAYDSRPSVVAPEFDEFYVANIWPDEPAAFRTVWTAYYAALEQLSNRLAQLFALALDLPADWFADKLDHHYSSLMANYYPPQPEPPARGQLRRGAHTDYGAYTLLYQEDAPGGLQIQIAEGGWQDIPFVDRSFVINIGDLMARWTNDRWVSTLHRVVNPPREQADRDRVSIPFFVNPNVDAVIECIPSCAPAIGRPKYAPVLAGEWVLGKVQKTLLAAARA
jgi:isopenicillin N synthase-like dioxygenase